MQSFSFKITIIFLLFYAGFCMAVDPILEKQRNYEQERLDRFNSLRMFDNERTVDESEGVGKVISETVSNIMARQAFTFNDSVAFPQGIRDPFAIPSILLQSLASERSKKERKLSASAYAFSNTSLLSVPKIKLKGVMHHPKNPSPLAILLLNSETYMVREGDEVSFNLAEPSQVIKIKKINRLSVLIEVGTLGALVVVR